MQLADPRDRIDTAWAAREDLRVDLLVARLLRAFALAREILVEVVLVRGHRRAGEDDEKVDSALSGRCERHDPACLAVARQADAGGIDLGLPGEETNSGGRVAGEDIDGRRRRGLAGIRPARLADSAFVVRED